MSNEKSKPKLFSLPGLAQTLKRTSATSKVQSTASTSRPRATPRIQENKVSSKSNIIIDSFTVSLFNLPTTGFGYRDDWKPFCYCAKGLYFTAALPICLFYFLFYIL